MVYILPSRILFSRSIVALRSASTWMRFALYLSRFIVAGGFMSMPGFMFVIFSMWILCIRCKSLRAVSLLATFICATLTSFGILSEFMLTLGLVMPVAISLARGALKAKS